MSSRARRVHTRRRKSRAGKTVLIVVVVLILAIIAGGATAYGIGKSWLKDLPDYTDPASFDTAQPTRIFAADGTLLARLYLENRENVSMSEMGAYLATATVAVEDVRFYEHKGVDPIGIARALLVNFTSGDSTGEGASTITQQYIRNTILLDEKYRKSYERKVREGYLAYKLEQVSTKDQILEMYLNTIYYGEGAYGAEAAAKTFFGKSAKDLTLSQSALLAGLPQQPSRLSPYDNLEGAVARRNTVLRRMLTNEKITKAEYDAAIAEPVIPVRAEEPANGVYAAPYFVAHVKKELQKQFTAATVFKGGLDVYTTLDMKLQKAAEDAVAANLYRENDPDAALVSINPENGHVVALYGGRNFTDTQFNLATQAKRQPGSSFKVFTLVTAINEGMPPTFRLDSSSPAEIKTDSGPWKVQNSGGGGRGMVTLTAATQASLNTPFARLIVALGPQKVVDTAHKMGITSELSAVPALTLGTSGVTPYEMASAFGTLATGGMHHDPVVITKVADRKGTVLYEEAAESTREVDAGVAFVVNEILKGDITSGTATRAKISRPAAGKTGTSQDNRDSWFVGYTPDLVTSVWVGFSEEKTVKVGGSLAWGGTICAPIWKDYMLVATDGVPVRDFPVADPPKYDPSKFDVPGSSLPDMVGMTVDQVAQMLEGYTVTTTQVYSQYPVGTILSQRIEDSTVFIEVSMGPEPVIEPITPPSEPTTPTPSTNNPAPPDPANPNGKPKNP